MFEGLVNFWKEHTTAILITIAAVVVGAIIVTVVIIFLRKKKNHESFVEHYIGTDEYDDQYKYAETYVNSVLGV